MSVLSNLSNTVSASSVSKFAKNAKGATVMSEPRCKVKIVDRNNQDGTVSRAYFLGVLTAEKFRLTAKEQATLLSHFDARPANAAGEYVQRTRFSFHLRPDNGTMRAWYWLADTDMVSKAEVQEWTQFLGKPAKRGKVQEFIAAEVAPAKKSPATKVAKAQAAPAAKVAVEWSIG